MAKRNPIQVGDRFTRLVVVAPSPNKTKTHGRKWFCLCDCGNRTEVADGDLRLPEAKSPGTKSCGCSNGIHHMSHLPEHEIWFQMVRRGRPNHAQAQDYYDRGIRVCDKWQEFPAFYADMGPRPSPKHSLERVDNDGNYCPENCVWATRKAQALNTRRAIKITVDGQTMCFMDFAKLHNIHPRTAAARMYVGWPITAAILIPTGNYHRR